MSEPTPQTGRDETRQVAAIRDEHGARPRRKSKRARSFWNQGGNCLLLILLGVVFLIGGVLGGVAGGSFLLWVNHPEGVAYWPQTPTPTLTPTVTPAPVELPTPTSTPEPAPTALIEDIIAETIPSVVTIINYQNNGLATVSPDDGRVVGSGIIVDERGYVATNYHVIENSRELRVILTDGREFIGELVASQPEEDLGMVKINAINLVAVKWGDSTTIRPGQTVYAIGSPLGDFPSSISQGVVSGLNRALEMDDSRVIDGLIQTDAAINRGSSGGPLINIHGEVIGLNTFIIRESEDRGIAEGIAFSIPSNEVRAHLMPWMAAHSGAAQPIPAGGETEH
jgi:2-alkenal reductase